MRQIFSSARLENVERVAELLRAEGIEVQIANGRSYKGSRRSSFSYRDHASGPRPAVWVTHSADQPRARELLHAAGLLQHQPTTRSYLGRPDSRYTPDVPAPRRKVSRAAKIRYTLLGGVALVVAVSWLSRPGPDASAPTRIVAPSPPPAPDTADGLAMVPPTVEARVHRLPVPRALAQALLEAELAARPDVACVAVDGEAPAGPLLTELQARHPQLRAASACDGQVDAASLDIANYRTDGSGTGTVEVRVADARSSDTRILQVTRTGRDWSHAPGD